MIRQAIFSLVAGGFIGVATGFVILKSRWLTDATIRFLRVALWFPFFVMFAVPDTFRLGIAAITLCTVYHYLTARSLLELQGTETLLHFTREATLQALFVSLVAQVWTQRWRWIEFPAMQNATVGLGVLTTLVVLLSLVNWVFKSNFNAISQRCAIRGAKELNLAGWSSFSGIALLTVVWLLFWQVSSSILGIPNSSLLDAIRELEFLFAHEVWSDITTSLLEIGGGMFLGGSVALAISSLLHGSGRVTNILIRLLPIMYISPLAVWLLVFLFVDWLKLDRSLFQFFIGYGHKIMGIGLLAFFPLVQGLWGFRDQALRYRVLAAIDHALPIAFVGMFFGELFAATAGLGFLMTVASATRQYQRGLAGFLIVVVLFVGLSALLKSIVKRLRISGTELRLA